MYFIILTMKFGSTFPCQSMVVVSLISTHIPDTCTYSDEHNS